jgi:hypothetical protein
MISYTEVELFQHTQFCLLNIFNDCNYIYLVKKEKCKLDDQVPHIRKICVLIAIVKF